MNRDQGFLAYLWSCNQQHADVITVAKRLPPEDIVKLLRDRRNRRVNF